MSTCRPITPATTTNALVLTSTGSADLVGSCLPFNIYGDSSSPLYSSDFLSGAADQVAYTYKKLGGDILDIELTACSVYACYEEAVLEYSYLLNIHQAKNVLSDVLGNTTGTFDHDGILKSGSLSSSLGSTHVSLKYPRFDFSYARRIAEGISYEVGVGGLDNEYSASFTVVAKQQDYDLQAIISASSDTAGLDFSGKVGNQRVLIKKVFYKTPHASWRFYGYYGGLNVVGNLSSYGQYSDDSTFEVIPVWQNRLQAKAYEDAIYVRNSHFSYELKNNKLRIFPSPPTSYVSKMWVQFTIPGDAWTEEDDSAEIGIDGINNMNSLPFGNLPFENINAIGKQWIRRFALSCAKEILGQVRGKFATIPIPNESVTLNGSELMSQAQDEKEKLREELKEILDQMTYRELITSDADLVEKTHAIQEKIPSLIFVG